MNFRIVEPERFDQSFSSEEKEIEFRDFVTEMVEKSNHSPEFSIGHENDRFGFSNEGTLQNLLEFEFDYICRENNDLIYLVSKLMHRIVEGHPFTEGNKRTSYAAACLFLITYELNIIGGNEVVIPTLDEELLDVLESIADNEAGVGCESIEKVIRPGFEEEIKKIL